MDMKSGCQATCWPRPTAQDWFSGFVLSRVRFRFNWSFVWTWPEAPHAPWGCPVWRFEGKQSSLAKTWNVRNVGAVSLTPPQNVISCRVRCKWITEEECEHGAPSYHSSSHLWLFNRSKAADCCRARIETDIQQTVWLWAGGRANDPPCQKKDIIPEETSLWGVRTVFMHRVTDRAKSTSLFSLKLGLFSLSILVSAVGCLISSPHSTLIKAGPGPQKSCRFAWREIALLWKDSAWVKGNLLCISIFPYIQSQCHCAAYAYDSLRYLSGRCALRLS